jgi:hypothetical protein
LSSFARLGIEKMSAIFREQKVVNKLQKIGPVLPGATTFFWGLCGHEFNFEHFIK